MSQFLSQNLELGQRFLRRLATELEAAEATRLCAIAMPLRARLASLLLELNGRFGAEGSLVLPLSRQEIASMLGTRPETITRNIRLLEKTGYVKFLGREVIINDHAGLSQEAKAFHRPNPKTAQALASNG